MSSIEKIVNRFLEYYGIKNSDNPSLLSEIELRKIIVNLAKACYGLGIQESTEMFKEVFKK